MKTQFQLKNFSVTVLNFQK